MIKEIAFIIWFFLPAGAANIAPILAAHWGPIRKFNRPIDGGKTWRGKPLLGKNKTWRGFIAGWLAAVAFIALQYLAVENIPALNEWSLVDYTSISLVLVATMQAFGALGGDSIKSFFKRQIGIHSGQSWVPFDQIDFLLGAALSTFWLVDLPLSAYLGGFAFGFFAHIFMTHVGFWLNLKDQPI